MGQAMPIIQSCVVQPWPTKIWQASVGDKSMFPVHSSMQIECLQNETDRDDEQALSISFLSLHHK